MKDKEKTNYVSKLIPKLLKDKDNKLAALSLKKVLNWKEFNKKREKIIDDYNRQVAKLKS